ncbi:hypothetical protein ATANTOWER_023230 [Ataeniobius toweri]|uniref:Peptidase A2 domain-containing protein n=1 Tax=Ataeniobius toweri TaxID=208326 RepID=A0ABU7AQR7_9TELE|nr:hypothetical protein [Ataeniobius toweri]
MYPVPLHHLILILFVPNPNPCRSEGQALPLKNGNAGCCQNNVYTVGRPDTLLLSAPCYQKTGSVSRWGDLADHQLYPERNRFTIPATILFSQESLNLSALIDSGSKQNLIDQRLVDQAQIDTEPLPNPQHVSAIDD